MVQGGDPTGTGKGGTSIYGQKLYVAPPSPVTVLLVQLLTQNKPPTSIPNPAKTRSTQNYGSQVPESWQWPTRAPTQTVRYVPFLTNDTNLDCRLTTFAARNLLFSRFAILYDAGSDAILGQ